MDSENWKQYRQDQQDRRKERLPIRTAEILKLTEYSYKVEKLTDYQFRINETLDLYPIHNRFHNIKTGKRGGYGDLHKMLQKQILS